MELEAIDEFVNDCLDEHNFDPVRLISVLVRDLMVETDQGPDSILEHAAKTVNDGE